MRSVFLTGLLLFFAAGMVFAQQDEGGAGTWDFGRIRVSDGIVKHVFALKNDSAGDLNIGGINASCGCTVSEVDRKVVPPRESANLEVKFDPRGYSGQITQYVYVNTDSKDTPVYRFVIKADIIKD